MALTFAAMACGDSAPPPPTPETGTPDAGTDASDAGSDAADASTPDGAVDAEADAGTPDVVASDAPLPDMGPGEPIAICEEGEPVPSCSDPCRSGAVCVDEFCGGQACVPGRSCTEDGHCGDGRSCVREEGAPPEVRGVCTAGSGACTADTDCALGFRCEDSACVDRRIPCGFHENGCPRGYTCTFADTEGRPFCVPGLVPCTSDGMCGTGARCVDVDDDGETECLPVGTCDSNEGCDAGESCGVEPGTSQSSCEPDGACRGGECPDGFRCDETGIAKRCVATGGTCTADADCPALSICGSIEASDPPSCLTYDTGADS